MTTCSNLYNVTSGTELKRDVYHISRRGADTSRRHRMGMAPSSLYRSITLSLTLVGGVGCRILASRAATRHPSFSVATHP